MYKAIFPSIFIEYIYQTQVLCGYLYFYADLGIYGERISVFNHIPPLPGDFVHHREEKYLGEELGVVDSAPNLMFPPSAVLDPKISAVKHIFLHINSNAKNVFYVPF